MKKTISILLIVAMLMSMIVVSVVPASATTGGDAATVTGADTSVITGGANATGVINEATGADAATAGNKMTPGDATRAAQLEAEGYIPVVQNKEATERTDDINITELAEGGKYYLAESFTVPSTVPTVKNITFDGNGHTLTISNSLFNETHGIVIRNLTLEGSIGMDCTSALNRYIPKGVTVIENFTSSVDITYNSGKNHWTPAGVTYSTDSGSSLTNVLYDGVITIQGDSNSTKALFGAAGMVSGAVGTTFTNCISDGKIVVTAPDAFNGASVNDRGIGGIAGKATGNCTFENCTNNMDITVSSKAYKYCKNLGGIAGFSNAGTTYTNCVNYGDITLNEGATGWEVGGIVGHVWDGVSFEKCTNRGNLICNANIGNGVGGILGFADYAVTTLNNCKNVGNISSPNQNVGGMVGYAKGDYSTDSLTVKNSTNLGNIQTAFVGGGLGGWLQLPVTVDNFVNGDANDPTKAKVSGGSGTYLGGLSGAFDNVVKMSNVINYGKIEGNSSSQLGGIAGFLKGGGIVENCENRGDVIHTGNTSYIGGIAGDFRPGSISNVVNRGDVSQTGRCYFVGGIAGQLNSNPSTIKNVLNEGAVTYNNSTNYPNKGDDWVRVSGMMGHSNFTGTYNNCANNGDVSFTDTAEVEPTGIFVSGIEALTYNVKSFNNCANNGDITVNAYVEKNPNNSSSYYSVGGLLAWSNGSGTTYKITNCSTNAGIVVNGGAVHAGNEITVGGFIGYTNSGALYFDNCETYTSEYENGETRILTVNSPNTVCCVGGFVGRSGSTTSISNSTNRIAVKTVKAYSSLGGFAGAMVGKIEFDNSTNDAPVTLLNLLGGKYHGAGGFVGSIQNNQTNTFENCENTENGVITQSSSIGTQTGTGGFVGRVNGEDTIYPNLKLTFKLCVNSGDIVNGSSLDENPATDATKAYNGATGRGGFVGQGNCAVNFEFDTCVNDGNLVMGDYDSGGDGSYQAAGGFIGIERFAGFYGPAAIKKGIAKFTNCINNGTVEDVNAAGGFIGKNFEIKRGSSDNDSSYDFEAIFNSCLNTGTISAANAAGLFAAGTHTQFGGANIDIKVDSSLNVGDIFGTAVAGGLIGITENGTVEMTNSLNNGSVAGGTVAGLVGKALPAVNVSVSDSYAIATISGSVSNPIGNGVDSFAGNMYSSSCYAGEVAEGEMTTAAEIEEKIIGIVMIAGYHVDDIAPLITQGDSIVATEDPDKYSTYTWNALISALEYAKEVDAREIIVINDDESVTILTQGEVSKAYNALYKAVNGLIEKSELPLLLDLTIFNAEKYYDSTDVYTSVSWTVFTNAMSAAKALQAQGGIDNMDPEIVMSKITALEDAMAGLTLGGNIVSSADFNKLNGQKGVFYLLADITITAPVDSFSGVLYGNGYTITVSGCGIFTKLSGATVQDLTVNGDCSGVDSLFGTASGKVNVSSIDVEVEEIGVAALFEAGESNSNITIEDIFSTADAGDAALVANISGAVSVNGALIMADAPSIARRSTATITNSYLDGVEYYDGDGSCVTDEEVFASGRVAYEVNEYVGSIVLVQKLGEDALPIMGAPTVDGFNVVIKDGDTYKNAGYKYDGGVSSVPSMPEETPSEPVYDALRAVIDRADALNSESYTEDSWAAMTEALLAAKKALWLEDQTKIDAATSALNMAVAALKRVSSAVETVIDYGRLDAAIAAVEALTASDYTDGSWAMLQAMLEMAKAAKAATSQEAVDSATSSLNTAKSNLKQVVKEEVKAPEADATDPAVTEPSDEEGCGGIVGGAAVVMAAVIALGAGISFKKKED